jgi:hypothetical protein
MTLLFHSFMVANPSTLASVKAKNNPELSQKRKARKKNVPAETVTESESEDDQCKRSVFD